MWAFAGLCQINNAVFLYLKCCIANIYILFYSYKPPTIHLDFCKPFFKHTLRRLRYCPLSGGLEHIAKRFFCLYRHKKACTYKILFDFYKRYFDYIARRLGGAPLSGRLERPFKRLFCFVKVFCFTCNSIVCE